MGSTVEGPQPQGGVGVVASFDFTRDRELWRWVPENVSLFIARTDQVSAADNLEMVSTLNRSAYLERPTREVCALGAKVVIFACTACSFVGGVDRERALRETMLGQGARRALTTAGAVVEALRTLKARRMAVVHPYSPAVGQRLREFLIESDLAVVSNTGLDLPAREVPQLSYAQVATLIRDGDRPDTDALFVSCTALPTYDIIAPLEQQLGKPIVTANQALRALDITAVGPEQALIGA